MTNKPMLSVERELLERLTKGWNGTAARKELRAILDKSQVEPCATTPFEAAVEMCSHVYSVRELRSYLAFLGALELHNACIALYHKGYRLTDEQPVAKDQGDPACKLEEGCTVPAGTWCEIKTSPPWTKAEIVACHDGSPVLAVPCGNGIFRYDTFEWSDLRNFVFPVQPTGQNQGEPVYMVRSHGSDCWEEMSGESLEMCQAQPAEYEVRKLYAEQPAPVALVMPERLNTEGGYSLEAETWYNLALDDVASLNGVTK